MRPAERPRARQPARSCHGRPCEPWRVGADTRANAAAFRPRIDRVSVVPGPVTLYRESSLIRPHAGRGSISLNPSGFTVFDTQLGTGTQHIVTDAHVNATNRVYQLETSLPGVEQFVVDRLSHRIADGPTAGVPMALE